MRTEETSVETPRLRFLRCAEAHYCKEFLLSCVFISRSKDLVEPRRSRESTGETQTGSYKCATATDTNRLEYICLLKSWKCVVVHGQN